ncbi:MAG: ATP-binding protein [Nitrospinae bacterium]|nr:ATP-binding protein [Nitrospinota bacterium]
MLTYYDFTQEVPHHWKILPINLKAVNLIVGASGSGKSRFLNTFTHFCEFITEEKEFYEGRWEVHAEAGGFLYKWEVESKKHSSKENEIFRELLTRESPNGPKINLIIRTSKSFKFNDKEMPKLRRDKLSVSLLKEEDDIAPIFSVFSKYLRRDFQGDSLTQASSLMPLPAQFNKKSKSDVDVKFENIWKEGHSLSSTLFILHRFFPKVFSSIVDSYKEVFPIIQEIKVDPHADPDAPVFPNKILPVALVKEKGVSEWIPISQLSSGMKKVLLIITDIITLPKESIYMIDEYENSLGINAIDFLPQFILDKGKDIQYFITTHHPYLINQMPIKDWLVFHREGSTVKNKSGIELEALYGKSKQQAFVQLINDPFYSQVSE